MCTDSRARIVLPRRARLQSCGNVKQNNNNTTDFSTYIMWNRSHNCFLAHGNPYPPPGVNNDKF